MLRWAPISVAVLASAVALAQEHVPGILKGEILEWQAGTSGEFSLRTADNVVHLCQYDSISYLEKAAEHITPSAIRPGDKVEVVADRKPGSSLCYARTIKVDEYRANIPSMGRRLRLRQPLSNPALLPDYLFPRGDLTFAGVVKRIDSSVVVLRLRDGVEKTLLLRQDTRFAEGGLPAVAGALLVNTRVFVRAGRNLDHELEAFQVVWGSITGP